MKQLLLAGLMLLVLPLSAATYNLSSGSYPPCSTSWSVSGSTYRCSGNGRITLNSGDIVIANTNATLIANNGLSLNGVTIGTTTNRINVQSDYGSIDAVNTNTIWGNVSATSAAITLNSTTVNGTISTSGNINLTAGAVTGLVSSSNNTITTTNTNLAAGATARSGISVTGGTVAGSFVLLANNPLTFSGVTMTTGSISGASSVSVSNSQLGTAGSMINVNSNSDAITLSNNSVVYGVLQAPGYSTINVQSGSQVYGQCLPNSTPANACVPYEVLPQARAHYPLDLCADVSNGVISDLIGNYPATGINIAAVADGRVLEAGDLSAAGNDYINVPAAALTGLGNFSLSLWFRLDAGSGFRELFSASSNSSDTELELYINGSNEVRAGLKGSYHNFAGGSSSPVVANNVWTQATLTRSGSQLCLYLNNQLVRCVSASSENLSVQRAAVGVWWRANGTRQDDFRGDIDEVLLFNQSLSQTQINQMYQNQSAGLSFNGAQRSSACQQCLADDFSGVLSPDNWVTARSSGNFTPSVVDGRLRLTQAAANQSTSATFQRLYPAANNLVVIEFDYYAWSPQGGTGADGVALILSDATITPQPGAFGGSLGYAQKGAGTDCPNCPGFAGGWLGIALDEYGNFSSATEGRNGGPGIRSQSVSVRGSAAGNYQYLTGTAANISPRIDVRSSNAAAPGHRYRITVDSRVAGQALVSVLRNTGSGFTEVIPAFNALSFPGQAPVPENFFLSFTGSTGGSNNNHELDNLSICALRSLPVGVLIDHFQLSHPAETVSCLAAPVEVKACLNNRCLDGADIYTDPVTVTLTASGNASWAEGNTVTLTNGVGTAYLRNPVIGANPEITIEAVSSVPAAKAFFRGRNRCIVGAGGTPCKIRFVNSGLIFAAVDGESALTHQTAGASFNAVLRAIRTNTTTGACEARATGSQPVQLGFSCENPGSCIAGQQYSVNGNPIAANAAASSANRSTVNLTFAANGSAALAMNYTDVGQLSLHASLTLPEQLPDPAITLNGSSNAFVVRPHTLAVVQAMRQNGTANPGTTNAGDGFVAAGEAFDVVIESRNAAGVATPNFGREASRQLVTTAFDALEYPAGGSNGQLAEGQTNITLPAANGQQRVTDVSWNEVGSISLQARLNNNLYLGVADVSAKPASGVIGRFYPNTFSLDSASVLNSCRLQADVSDHFSYMSEQKLTVNYQLLATGVAGNTLHNYDATLYTDTAEMLVVAENNLVRLDAARLALNAAQWQHGVYTVAQTDAAFNRTTTPDGPYAALQFGLQVLPGSERDNRNFSTFTLGTDAVALNAPEQALRMRYGRLLIQNTAGPEEDVLPLVFRSEYWNGSAFTPNLADNCSQINPALLANPPLNTTPLQFGGSVQTMINGELAAGPVWIAPTGSTGNWLVEYQAPEHLRYQWRSPAAPARACDPALANYQQCPQADIMFGRFRGNPRQIFWRERFQ
ncbi:MAG: hypothetical protein KKE08_07385 [Gammaproteobacteria bacterium]|nr:hypothetical protein [Gammaproteobacteria bacterium]MBU2070839.1 hypothetical protein [Gammaproteobacteria bacterium]MBU2182830.1 hypothetical protein [Gammaproteobacteria bacterium]MBU2203615.1 hypothetical protein [Gammaproteobacteria bacterium]